MQGKWQHPRRRRRRRCRILQIFLAHHLGREAPKEEEKQGHLHSDSREQELGQLGPLLGA